MKTVYHLVQPFIGSLRCPRAAKRPSFDKQPFMRLRPHSANVIRFSICFSRHTVPIRALDASPIPSVKSKIICAAQIKILPAIPIIEFLLRAAQNTFRGQKRNPEQL